jgi:hypothetical protein
MRGMTLDDITSDPAPHAGEPAAAAPAATSAAADPAPRSPWDKVLAAAQERP